MLNHCPFMIAFLVWSALALDNEGLSNKHIRVALSPIWHPVIYAKCPNNTVWDCFIGNEDVTYHGMMWDVLMFMKQSKNLSYTMIPTSDWSGTCYDSNNCTGMIGIVTRDEADIALGRYNTIQMCINELILIT